MMNMEFDKQYGSSVSSDDDTGPVTCTKKRVQRFSDSENELNKENLENTDVISPHKPESEGYDSEKDFSLNNKAKKSRIKKLSNSDSDGSSSTKDFNNQLQKKYESVRTESKKKNLKDKFKNLLSSGHKSKVSHLDIAEEKVLTNSDKSENSDDEISCLKIKQKIKKSAHVINSLCDPDTSDDESNKEIKSRKKPKPKTTKSTSPKPMRMSSKQAMENMQKIKSESNRMLREKEVSLPYHRPKALSLKDILNRRKLAVSADGKALPIKMNSEQLQQYALMLEQRQKEVIELCKSDTDEENMSEDESKDDNIDNKMQTETMNNMEIDEVLSNKYINEDKGDNTTIIHNGIQKETASNMEIENTIVADIQDESFDKPDIINDGTCATDNDNLESNGQNNLISNENEIEVDKVQEETVNSDLVKSSEVVEIVEHNAETKNNQTNKNIGVLCNNTEQDSQIISLHYDSEKVEKETVKQSEPIDVNINQATNEPSNIILEKNNKSLEEDFSDTEIDFDEIDKIIENSQYVVNDVSKSYLKSDIVSFKSCPKLTGLPGTIINLDTDTDTTSRKLCGVELLKERFTYYAKLQSLEEKEKDREKKYKPGTQHLKLKQELEEQIAEQRSMEWEKRMNEEKQLKADSILSDEDEIDKIESKLVDTEEKVASESSGEEEPIEDDVILEDKPKKRNPMVDDEAEESDGDDSNAEEVGNADVELDDGKKNEDNANSDIDDGDDEDEETSDSSSESEEEVDSKPKKGRILKAFEDSDDESPSDKLEPISHGNKYTSESDKADNENEAVIKDTQDDELQLAQMNKSSEDLFSTQESATSNLTQIAPLQRNTNDSTSADLGSQTFSILNSANALTVDLNTSNNIAVAVTTQGRNKANFGTIAGTCSGSFSLAPSVDLPPLSQSQEIGDDIAAMCTGKFYDNPFVSQTDSCVKENNTQDIMDENDYTSQEIGDDVAALCTGKFYDNPFVSQNENANSEPNISDTPQIPKENILTEKKERENTILKSILDELDEPDIDKPKQNKYFVSNIEPKDANMRKKFVIESDDEIDHDETKKSPQKTKKFRKRKAEQRALHISDDEEEEFEEDMNDDESDIDDEADEPKNVEYDSEENEVVVAKPKASKKKRMGEFFENEAELTSEDEWVGSGDEDERGLDRMEREEGDDDHFHQGQLQKELGQIHMREVLDQDKREVRLLQELLFEDGDLGDGHRQRKFRWKNADGEEEMGTNPDELANTQEEEFESEEQWRKERHEREMFLRKMQETEDDTLNTSINRSAIIKANLCSRSMSMLLAENSTAKTEKQELVVIPEKKSTKDIPSPKKPFTIFQQNYHGSLLTRGRGALARLAALATPLAATDDAPKALGSHRRNFVFAAVTPDEEEPKVTKRKAEKSVGTPRLIKKMKTEETNKHLKNSLFDHLKT